MVTNNDLKLLRSMVRDFTDNEIRPIASQIDKEKIYRKN